MNLTKEFTFPTVTDIQMALGHGNTNPTLLKEAQARGFDKSSNPYNKLFNKLFFSGGKLNFKNDLDPTFKDKALRYLTALMRSFEPRHEHKEAVCALILSELVEADETE